MNRNTLRKETSISRSVGGSCALDMRQCMLFACLIVCSPKQNEMRSVLYMGATAMQLLNGTRDCTVVRIKRTPVPIREFHLKTYLCSYRSPLFIITIHDKLSNALGHKAQLLIWNYTHIGRNVLKPRGYSLNPTTAQLCSVVCKICQILYRIRIDLFTRGRVRLKCVHRSVSVFVFACRTWNFGRLTLHLRTLPARFGV